MSLLLQYLNTSMQLASNFLHLNNRTSTYITQIIIKITFRSLLLYKYVLCCVNLYLCTFTLLRINEINTLRYFFPLIFTRRYTMKYICRLIFKSFTLE